MGKWCRISSTSYTSLPPGPAPPAHGRADLGFSERHVDIVALYLHVVLGDGLHSREGERFPCDHVELRAVARALYLRADQLSLVQRPGVVGADVLDGVELPVHVAESDPVVLHLVDVHLAGGDVPRLRYLVELGHDSYATRSSKPSPILPSIARSSFSLRPLRGMRLVTSPKKPKTTSFSASRLGMPRLIKYKSSVSST